MSNTGFKPLMQLQYGDKYDIFRLDNNTNQARLDNNTDNFGAVKLGNEAVDLDDNKYILARGYAGIRQYEAVVIDENHQAWPLTSTVKGKFGICINKIEKRPSGINFAAYFLISGKTKVLADLVTANYHDQACVGLTPGSISNAGTDKLLHAFFTSPVLGTTAEVALHDISTVGDGSGPLTNAVTTASGIQGTGTTLDPIKENFDNLPLSNVNLTGGTTATTTLQAWTIPNGEIGQPFFTTPGNQYEVWIDVNGVPFRGNMLGTNGGHVGTFASISDIIVWLNSQLVASGSTAVLAYSPPDVIYVVGSDVTPTSDTINILIGDNNVIAPPNPTWYIKGRDYNVQTTTITTGGSANFDFVISDPAPVNNKDGSRLTFANLVALLNNVLNFIKGADNGVSIGTDGKIELGGVLHKNTVIDHATFDLNFNGTANSDTILKANNDLQVGGSEIQLVGGVSGAALLRVGVDSGAEAYQSTASFLQRNAGSPAGNMTVNSFVDATGGVVVDKLTVPFVDFFRGIKLNGARTAFKNLLGNSGTGEYYLGHQGYDTGTAAVSQLPATSSAPTLENLAIDTVSGQVVRDNSAPITWEVAGFFPKPNIAYNVLTNVASVPAFTITKPSKFMLGASLNYKRLFDIAKNPVNGGVIVYVNGVSQYYISYSEKLVEENFNLQREEKGLGSAGTRIISLPAGTHTIEFKVLSDFEHVVNVSAGNPQTTSTNWGAFTLAEIR